MLSVSDKVNEAWFQPSRQLNVRITIEGEVYDNASVTSLSFGSGSISGEQFAIGSTYSNQVQITFPMIIESIKKELKVKAEIGVLIEEDDPKENYYAYTKLGYFFISEFDRDRNSDKTTVTAVDKMAMMEGPYVSKLKYPALIQDVALEAANMVGAEIDQSSFLLLPKVGIKEPVGYTYRQAIGLIAQFAGGFANFNRDGKLQIRQLQPTNFSIPMDNYMLKGFTKNENSYRIGGITVTTGQESEDEEDNKLHIGAETGNQVELENKCMTEDLLRIIWDKVNGIIYYPFELSYQGNPNLEAGDWVYVYDKEGNRYSVPALTHSFEYNGGMTAKIQANTSGSSEATYEYKGTMKQQIEKINSVLQGANGWNSNYYDSEEPKNPKVGDLWFKPNGKDIEIWIYKNVDGVEQWVFEISTAPNEELLAAVEEAKKAGEDAQKAGEDAKQAGWAAETAANDAKSDAAKAVEDANKAVTDSGEALETANKTQSQVIKMDDFINTRVVTKDGLINQININEEGILIDGENVWITGKTKIDDAVIGQAQIKDLAVSTAKIANAAVSEAKIANLAVSSAKIKDAAITTAKIGDAQIIGAKIQDASISSAKIIYLDAAKIAAGEVTGLILKSPGEDGTFYVEGDHLVLMDNKTEEKIEVTSEGILGYSKKGDLKIRMTRRIVNSQMFGTNNTNTYLTVGDISSAKADHGEVRSVLYTTNIENWDDTGSKYEYTYRPFRGSQAFVQKVTLNTAMPGNLMNLYMEVPVGGEVRITGIADGANYRDLRANKVYVKSLMQRDNDDSNFYLGVSGTGRLRVTNKSGYNNGNPSYRDVQAKSFIGKLDQTSSFDKKQDIMLDNKSALDCINFADIYNYRYKDDVEEGNLMLRTGLIIGPGYHTPECIINTSRKTIDLYGMTSVAWKAIQELDDKNKSVELEIADLRGQVAILNQKIEALQAA